MNTDQLQSIIRTILKIGSGLLVAHGLGDTASIINAPDVTGTIMLIVSIIWSHWSHSAPPATASPSVLPKSGSPLLLVAISVMLAGTLLTGCGTTPQQATYQAVGITGASVPVALGLYDQLAAAGKTTPADNARVKADYLKYQAAFNAVCDAGAIYAASNTTNAPAAQAALEQAITNADQMKGDFLELLSSFGVKL